MQASNFVNIAYRRVMKTLLRHHGIWSGRTQILCYNNTHWLGGTPGSNRDERIGSVKLSLEIVKVPSQ